MEEIRGKYDPSWLILGANDSSKEKWGPLQEVRRINAELREMASLFFDEVYTSFILPYFLLYISIFHFKRKREKLK